MMKEIKIILKGDKWLFENGEEVNREIEEIADLLIGDEAWEGDEFTICVNRIPKRFRDLEEKNKTIISIRNKRFLV